MTSSYYKGAHGIFIVYDVTDRESFLSIGNWLPEIEQNSTAGVSKVLIGNKTDLDYKRQVTKEEGQVCAKKFGMKFIETSAKQASNVQEAFKIMARDIRARLGKIGNHTTPSSHLNGTSSHVAKGMALLSRLPLTKFHFRCEASG